MGILEIFFGAIALGLIVGAIHYIGDKSCHIIFDPLKKKDGKIPCRLPEIP